MPCYKPRWSPAHGLIRGPRGLKRLRSRTIFITRLSGDRTGLIRRSPFLLTKTRGKRACDSSLISWKRIHCVGKEDGTQVTNWYSRSLYFSGFSRSTWPIHCTGNHTQRRVISPVYADLRGLYCYVSAGWHSGTGFCLHQRANLLAGPSQPGSCTAWGGSPGSGCEAECSSHSSRAGHGNARLFLP